jgi:hypothetical protein
MVATQTLFGETQQRFNPVQLRAKYSHRFGQAQESADFPRKRQETVLSTAPCRCIKIQAPFHDRLFEKVGAQVHPSFASHNGWRHAISLLTNHCAARRCSARPASIGLLQATRNTWQTVVVAIPTPVVIE